MPHDDTPTRILEAAGVIFAERGYRAATIRDICERAGVNLASVNYHFGDKERLYAAVIQHAHQFHCGRAPLPEWPRGTRPQDKLRDFILVTLTRMLAVQELSDADGEPPWQTRVMMREMLQPTAGGRALVEGHVRPHFALLLSILDELLPPSTPQQCKHQLAFSVISQCVFYRFNGPVVRMLIPQDELQEHFTPAQLAAHITAVMLAALERAASEAGWKRRNPMPAPRAATVEN